MHRTEYIQDFLESGKLDGFFICKPENVRYISGFTGDDSYLFITRTKQYFITDPRYTEQAALECPDYELVNWRTPGNTIGTTIHNLLSLAQGKTVAFEAQVLTYSDYKSIAEKVQAELVPTEGVIEKFRAVKSEEEIKFSSIACEIASRAFEKIVKDIRVGITEKELASRLSHYMVMEGADTKPYGGILISGARTSLLHGIPSSKSIEYGDLVLMDYGCQYKGYMSDMTRTVVAGKADEKQKKVYALEKQMQEACIGVLKEGITGKDAYEASVAPLINEELLEYHYKGIGHGIGLFVHEPPFLGPNSDAVLEAGNIITVEPGIYIPGWGGVRIEDQLLITKEGCKNLISATRELIEL